MVSEAPGDCPPANPLLVIVGPTGSGKSALALELAGPFNGEIVNCDSLQFYRGFDIGSAKTPILDRREIPHHLFDVREPEEGYSAGEYSRAARLALHQISLRGRLPIVAGGTGFYLRALLEGLPSLPERNDALRARLAAKEARNRGVLHRLLIRLEPSAAEKIHARDVQKLIRALEIHLTTRTARPPMESAARLEGYSVIKIGLHPDRSELCARLDLRAAAMFRGDKSQGGILDEVRALMARGAAGPDPTRDAGPDPTRDAGPDPTRDAGPDPTRQTGSDPTRDAGPDPKQDAKPFESLGYKQALAHIRGTLTLEAAIESTQIETRQYAKRQLTWFRRDPAVHWLAGFGDDPDIHRQAAVHIRRAKLD